MTDDLVFLMGKYEARLPTDRRYAESHVWFKEEGGGYRVGLTSYAVRLLQDVYFLDWGIEPHTPVMKKQEIGQVESSKAVSALYAPVEGIVGEFNPALMNDPSLINVENYDGGWLYEMQTTARLLTAAEYVSHLESTWDATQRMLKNQHNEG